MYIYAVVDDVTHIVVNMIIWEGIADEDVLFVGTYPVRVTGRDDHVVIGSHYDIATDTFTDPYVEPED